jgi:hypothetical protein
LEVRLANGLYAARTGASLLIGVDEDGELPVPGPPGADGLVGRDAQPDPDKPPSNGS